jgi:UDP-3-O-acyl N-acetylglucosamine deacetylase
VPPGLFPREDLAVIRIGQRPQRTLAKPVAVNGVGLVGGARVTARFCPAPAGTGLLFHRTDLSGAEPLPALADRVSGTQRRTTLGTGENQIAVVEHVLSALAGMRVDNCVIEIDGPEPPGLDGSALGFAEALVEGGLVLQTTPRPIWGVSEPVVVAEGGATLSIHPATGTELRVSYLLDYGPRAPLAPQAHSETITPESYLSKIAPSRTFLLEEEARALRQQGLGAHLTAADLLIFGPRGPLGASPHCGNEPARHKILDLIGDLALSGLALAGHVVAYRSGHALNVALAKALAAAARGAKAAPARRAG